jgi:hypothetical protein
MQKLYKVFVVLDWTCWWACVLGIVGILFGWAPDLRWVLSYMSVWIMILYLRDGARRMLKKEQE